MAPARRYRRRSSQPELPLRVDDAVPAGGPKGEGPTATWRLDEHTRQVGQRGIAAARAQLAASTTVDVGDQAALGRRQRTERAA
jgi:hypothetical protein